MGNSSNPIRIDGLRIAVLTGQSDPSRPALSVEQHALLDAIDLPESCKVRDAFPFVPAPSATDQASDENTGRLIESTVPLWLASMRNLHQFTLASTPLFRRIHAEAWLRFTGSAQQLILITGSCGLQFLNALRGVSANSASSIKHVFALGPVAWKRPLEPHTLIQGEVDRWSRLFFRRVAERLPDVGHMNYYGQSIIAQLINEYLCSNISK